MVTESFRVIWVDEQEPWSEDYDLQAGWYFINKTSGDDYPTGPYRTREEAERFANVRSFRSRELTV